jgi:hypothetical protein
VVERVCYGGGRRLWWFWRWEEFVMVVMEVVTVREERGKKKN